jgi:hypothetical protein
MRLEYLPIVFGAIVALAGLGLVADAWLPDRDVLHSRERRRRVRAERHRGGEACVGLAVMLLGAALIGRDTWTISVWLAAAACVFIIAGALLNRRYIREQLDFRGAARRDPTTDQKPGMPERTPPSGKFRVR